MSFKVRLIHVIIWSIHKVFQFWRHHSFDVIIISTIFCVSDGLYEGENPPKGTKVDSIKYYSNQLKEMNKELIALQIKKSNIAVSGNSAIKAIDWIHEILWKNKSARMKSDSQTLDKSSQEDTKEKMDDTSNNENANDVLKPESIHNNVSIEDELDPENSVQLKNDTDYDEINPHTAPSSIIFNLMTRLRNPTPRKSTDDPRQSSVSFSSC